VAADMRNMEEEIRHDGVYVAKGRKPTLRLSQNAMSGVFDN